MDQVKDEKELDNVPTTCSTSKKKAQICSQQTDTQQEVKTANINSYLDVEVEVETLSPPQEGTVVVTDNTVAADLHDLDEKIKSMMKVSEKRVASQSSKKNYFCTVCGKEGQFGNIRAHIEANHINGVSHTCNICGKVARSRKALANHKFNHSYNNWANHKIQK